MVGALGYSAVEACKLLFVLPSPIFFSSIMFGILRAFNLISVFGFNFVCVQVEPGVASQRLTDAQGVLQFNFPVLEYAHE